MSLSTPAPVWHTSRFSIALDRPRVMGILNLTPDSFSDGGRHANLHSALQHARELLDAGADILDLGGESTRPGAPPVSLEAERDRVWPVLQELLRWQVPLSIDTYKPELMQEALDLGVDIINDVWALQRPSADGQGTGLEVVAAHPRCGVCLMHMHLDPVQMQISPMSGDAVPQVAAFLSGRAQALCQRGVAPERIVLDSGIGFGKTVEQNMALLARQDELLALGYPLLAGWSRKSTLGHVTGRTVAAERVSASVAAALLAVQGGARVVRVHDVAATADALKVWAACEAQRAR